MSKSKQVIILFIAILLFGFNAKSIFAQSNANPVSIPSISVNLTTDPLLLPKGGGYITYIYRVNNTGTVPLNDVTILDDNCHNMSGELGDTNGNHLLDINETWIYNCSMNLKQTTTNIVVGTAFAEGLKAVDANTTTVDVAGTDIAAIVSPSLPNEGPTPSNVPGFPKNGPNPNTINITVVIWGILALVIIFLIVVLLLIRKKK